MSEQETLTLTSENWQRVKQALDAALEAPAAERATVLERLLGEDPELRRRAEAYLDLEDELGDFIETPAASLSPAGARDGLLGRRIGPYKVLALLGRGGMGAVYLAVREDDYEKRVALKLMHQGLGRGAMVDRFRRERQILARLEHPNIARLLDGGTTEDGSPYLVMEYVEGRRIDRYCDEQRLSIRRRLELFRQVCAAVHFAHRNLVVHRDLKPGNILVTPEGVPKLLDFGIAKLLDTEAITRLGDAGATPMTYQYASPEQVMGEPITTASDVYSLGVRLYELVTGRLPYRRGQYRHPAGLLRSLTSEEPQRPSTAVWREEEHLVSGVLTAAEVAVLRGGDPMKLKRQLAGDVDAIVMKALRQEPAHRYDSAAELEAEVGRHLEGLPVKARAGTFGYLAGKFVRRHKWGLATAAAFLALAVAFAVTLAMQLERTRTERNRATLSMNLLVEMLESPEVGDDESSTVEEVVRRGTDLFDAGFADDLEAQATAFNNLGLVYAYRGAYGKAEELLERAVELRRRLWGEDPRVAESLQNLAYLYWLQGEPAVAEPLARQALDIRRRHDHGPDRLFAKGLTSLASQLHALGRYDEAESLYREALRMKVELYGEDHLEVATSHANLGTLLYDQGSYAPARRHYQRALDVREELLPPGHPKLGKSYSHLARVLLATGGYAEAVPILRRVYAIRIAVHDPDHPEVAQSLNNLAFALERTGELDEAERHYRRALEIRVASFGDDHQGVATVRRNLASLLIAMERFAEAEALARQAVDGFKRPEGHWREADAESVLGAALAAQGRFGEAEELLLAGLQALSEDRGEVSLYAREARDRVIELYERWGRPREAAAFREKEGGGPKPAS